MQGRKTKCWGLRMAVSEGRVERAPIVLLMVTTAALNASAHVLVHGWTFGSWHVEWFTRWVPYFVMLFVGSWLTLGLLEFFVRGRQYTDQTSGQVNVWAIWQNHVSRPGPLFGTLVVSLMCIGVLGTSVLTEQYVDSSRWYDNGLWSMDRRVVAALTAALPDAPSLWDAVYFSLWPGVYFVLALLYRRGSREGFVEIALAIVLSYYLTRSINLAFPTAGPAFFRPGQFNVLGTTSEQAQRLIQLYMQGAVEQNGLMPGSMALPSLHVGLVAIAGWYLFSVHRWTLFATMPWLLLTWLSTVMLGWHYSVDGAAGIIVAVVAIRTARALMRRWAVRPGQSLRMPERVFKVQAAPNSVE